ncbi:MAG: hypothetical protein HY762_02870 [Planctomycetes bacterium]|nr:hypothetical protein [Planctomycetota bacterium]
MVYTKSLKQRPNHRLYLEVLRRLSPEMRLLKAFELSEFSRKLFIHGLRQRYHGIPNKAFKKILQERLSKCHNRNY